MGELAMVWNRITRWAELLATPGGRPVAYAVGLGLTVIAAVLVPGLEIQTSRQGMVREDLPVQARFLELMDDFGSPTQLVVVLEGAEPAAVAAAADAVAAAVATDQRWVRAVFHRVDLDRFRRAGLYFVPDGDLARLVELLEDRPQLAAAVMTGQDLAAIFGGLGEELRGLDPAVLTDPAFALVGDTLAAWVAALDGDPPATLDLAAGLEAMGQARLGGGSGIDAEGRLTSADGRVALVFVQQASSSDETTFVVPFIDHVRERVATALTGHPGVSAGFTGWPAMIAEDYGLLRTDLPRVSAVATALILAIFLAAFRSLHRTVLVFVPLVAGVLWTLGAVVVTIGHLNYLSSVFIGVLFGLGIDFGIYFIRQFDEERLTGAEPALAVSRALARAGTGIITGGLTAIVAFLAVAFTDQPAFTDLGLVAGMGVAAVLVATLLLLPPLLSHRPPDLAGAQREVRSPFLERCAAGGLARPRRILATAAVALAVSLLALPRVGFDTNLNNLLPEGSESVRVLHTLEERTPYSDHFVAVVADDMAQVRDLHQRLAELATVTRVESLAPMLPDGVEGKRELLDAIAARLPSANASATVTSMDGLRAALDDLLGLLEEAEEDAFAAGLTDTLEPIGELLESLGAIRDHLDDPGAEPAQRRFESLLFAERDRLVAGFRDALAGAPVTFDTLQPELRERFVGSSGRLLVMAFPTQAIWDLDFLDRFVGEVKGVAAEVIGADAADERVTGFAVTYQVTAPSIQRGFAQASWAAAVVVCLMLLFDLKSPLAAVVAATPLAVTAVGLLGGMALLGIELNMATQVAFPILFGLGVAYGVHMVHRLREEPAGEGARAVATTGKAIGLASATTMAGFGAMLIAEHSALRAFGAVLTAGIALSAVTALILVPLLGRRLHRR